MLSDSQSLVGELDHLWSVFLANRYSPDDIQRALVRAGAPRKLPENEERKVVVLSYYGASLF